MSWTTEEASEFGGKYKKFKKKHPEELQEALLRADKYFKILQVVGDPQKVNAPGVRIHTEGQGVIAFDQGSSKGKKAVRLYAYPDQERKILWLITVGDKDSQQRDVNKAHEFVRNLPK